MNEESIREISVVTVDGHSTKFKNQEEAVVYRNERLALQQEQERARARQKAEGRLRAEYDADPEYWATTISSPLAIEPDPGGWFRREVTESCVNR